MHQGGGLAVAVPGELRGYEALHKYLNGTLKWADLFEDAILLAKCGFPVGKHLAAALKEGEVVKTALANKTRRFFMNPDTGKVLTEGDTLIQEDLANTLEDIAKYGADYFYNGTFAVKLVEDVKSNDGIMTEADLKNYSVKWVDPINVTFQDNLTMFSAPPPGSGPVLAYIMAIVDAFRTSSDYQLPDNEQTLHKFIEACKYGYAKRALLGDVDFVNCQEVINNMTSRKYAEDTKSKINLTHTFDDPTKYGFINETYLPETGTAHAVFWGEDVVISVSSTINY
nr:scoloptoxin SSD14-like [Dermacentor andersoni]